MRYDALAGNLYGKLSVTVSGRFMMKLMTDFKSTQKYKGGEKPIAHTFSKEAKKYLNPEATVFFTVSENAKSSNIEFDLERKYTVSATLAIVDGDTIVYGPEIKPESDPAVKFNKDSFLDGSLTVTANASVEIRPLYSHDGLKLVMSSGPTLKGNLGRDSLYQMTREYKDTLYRRSAYDLATSLMVKPYSTHYKGGKQVGSSELSIYRKIKSVVTDGRYTIFPQFNYLEVDVASEKESRFKAESKTQLLAPINIGYEVEDKASKEIIIQNIDECIFSHYQGVDNILDALIGWGYGSYYPSNLQNFEHRVLVNYAGYIIKGPCEVADECSYDSKSSHPHAIDLGLPSKTLWACCHVGASKPEEYGKIFQQYSEFQDETWDDSWELPSYNQVVELVKSCKWIFSHKNGVVGWFATGPNGNTIFFPASGYISDNGSGHRYDTDQCMVIWSSSRKGNLGWRMYFLDEESIELLGPYGIQCKELSFYPDDEDRSLYGAFRLVKKENSK